MDLGSLTRQFSGRTFGELVMQHYEKLDLESTLAALQGTVAQLPPDAMSAVESWIDDIAPWGRDPAFWCGDCGETMGLVCARARGKLADLGVEASDEQTFSMFQIVVLNFAYGAHKHPETKAFIEQSIRARPAEPAVGTQTPSAKGFSARLFGKKDGKLATLERAAKYFEAAKSKAMGTVVDALSDPDLPNRKDCADFIRRKVVPVLDDDPNEKSRRLCLQTLELLIKELRPPRDEREMNDLGNAMFYYTKRGLTASVKDPPEGTDRATTDGSA